MKLLAMIGLFSGVLFSSHATAIDFFIGLDGMRSKVSIGNIDYTPTLKRARLGVFISPGIGLEINLADTLKADKEVGLEAGLDSHYAGMIRLQSPLDGGLSVYVNLGYGVTELLVASSDAALALEEKLESPFAAIGFQKQFDANPRISYFGEYDRIYSDDNIKISAFSLGYQYNF